MKTIQNLAIASFVKFVAADFSNMQGQLNGMLANSTTSMRAWDGKNAETIANLDEYGCWCYFLDNVGRGKGTPVDEIDSMCKILHDGYECAVLDTEAEGAECAPWDVTYHSGTGSVEDISLFQRCQNLNPDDNCAQRACAVEGYFIENLLAALVAGAVIDYDSYGHSKGNFDPSADGDCPVKKAAGTSNTRECCGRYPIRFPYKTLDGDRSCCVSRTFNTNLLNCCDGGVVKANC